MADVTREVVQADFFDAVSELPSDYAHAAVVDYPWEFEYENGSGIFDYHREYNENPMFSMLDDSDFVRVISELERVLVDGAWVLCFADDRFQDIAREALRESNMEFHRNWVWTPNEKTLGHYGQVNHYPIPVATNGPTERYVRSRSTLYSVEGGRTVAKQLYPTAKPPKLYSQLLQPPVLREGEILLEPFCGSGPGAVVANHWNCGYWGCDISDEAVEIARKRLEYDTGN